MKILLVSHGEFAHGMCRTARAFLGVDNVYDACVTEDGGTKALLDRVNGFLRAWGDEQVVICSDLRGGSANQAVLPLVKRPNTYIISGANFALLLQLAVKQKVTVELLREMVKEAQDDLELMNEIEASVDIEV